MQNKVQNKVQLLELSEYHYTNAASAQCAPSPGSGPFMNSHLFDQMVIIIARDANTEGPVPFPHPKPLQIVSSRMASSMEDSSITANLKTEARNLALGMKLT